MPETTTEPTALADLAARWKRQSAEYLTDWQDYDSHDGQERRGQGIALGDAASELRAALAAAPAGPDDAHTETVTEYRVVGRSGPGMSVEVVEGYSEADIEMARDQARYCVEDGWVEVAVESRTVTTSRRESEWKATDQ